MLMEAEMESNERGGGILNQMMGYGMMGGDFDDPRKRGHQGYLLSSYRVFIYLLSLIHFLILLVEEEKIKKTNRKSTCS
jgi:hypothetical protein